MLEGMGHHVPWLTRQLGVHLIAAAEDVHLVDEEDHLFAPLPDVLQEAHLAVRKRAVCST